MKKLHPSRQLGALAAAVALVALTGCGGPDGADAPKDATQEEFCKIIVDLDLSDPESFVDDLADVGTPTGIPAEAREGFEVMIDNATEDEISDDKQEKVNAFVSYFTSTCTPTSTPTP